MMSRLPNERAIMFNRGPFKVALIAALMSAFAMLGIGTAQADTHVSGPGVTPVWGQLFEGADIHMCDVPAIAGGGHVTLEGYWNYNSDITLAKPVQINVHNATGVPIMFNYIVFGSIASGVKLQSDPADMWPGGANREMLNGDTDYYSTDSATGYWNPPGTNVSWSSIYNDSPYFKIGYKAQSVTAPSGWGIDRTCTVYVKDLGGGHA